MLMWVYWIKNIKIYQHGILFVGVGIGLFVCGYLLSFFGEINTFITEVAKFLRDLGMLAVVGVTEMLFFLVFGYRRYSLSCRIKDVEVFFGKIAYAAVTIQLKIEESA